jgi:hypothetical protein
MCEACDVDNFSIWTNVQTSAFKIIITILRAHQRWALGRNLLTQRSFVLASPGECCLLAVAKDSPRRRILKWISHNQAMPEVEKKAHLDRIYTDKHLQKLAHAGVESESVEPLIQSTLGYWVQDVIRRASFVELYRSFHTTGPFVYPVPAPLFSIDSIRADNYRKIIGPSRTIPISGHTDCVGNAKTIHFHAKLQCCPMVVVDGSCR